MILPVAAPPSTCLWKSSPCAAPSPLIRGLKTRFRRRQGARNCQRRYAARKAVAASICTFLLGSSRGQVVHRCRAKVINQPTMEAFFYSIRSRTRLVFSIWHYQGTSRNRNIQCNQTFSYVSIVRRRYEYHFNARLGNWPRHRGTYSTTS